MPSPFITAGGVPDKQSRYAPLYVNRFYSGLFTNSNPLSEAATPALYQKFYSGSRYDTLRGGLNMEISPRLTLIRRPGSSLYNSATFPAINTFKEFRVFNPITKATQIIVIADTASAVYDATGPSTQTVLFNKLAGSGQTSFQSVGNTLFAGDGVSTWKYLWSPAWQANTTYTSGSTIIDSNGNIQAATNFPVGFPIPPNTELVAVFNNVVTIKWGNSSLWSATQLADLPGSTVTFSGFVGASFLNSQSAVITTATNIAHGSNQSAYLTFQFTHAYYAGTADNTGVVTVSAGHGTSGNSTPSWSATIGATTTDNTLTWTNKGPAVEDWGIASPSLAPAVANIPNTVAGAGWVASTFYSPSLCIVDSNNNTQLLTTPGATGNAVPTWNVTPGGTTADNGGGGTAVWTNQGSAVRATATAYTVGDVIAVQYSYTITTTVPGGKPHVQLFGPYYYFFQCTTAGTTSGASTASFSWQNGTVVDGTVTWSTFGPWITRTVAATSGGSGSVKGNISNSVLVSTDIQIIDSNGNYENIVTAGLSGGAHPTWATSSGTITADNQASWRNAGPSGGTGSPANTGAWQYGYAFKNSTTGHISSMSPASQIITLASASSVSITGQGDPNFATDGVDTIVVYRTVQGANLNISGGTLFQLTTIPISVGGDSWSYTDSTPDPPAIGSILNEFISADVTGNNAPPPTGFTDFTYYLNRIFGSVGVFGYYSGVATQPVGVGVESFGGQNFYQMPEYINQQWASATGLLIFTVHGVYFSQGVDSNGNPNTPIKLLEDIGLRSPNLFTVNGSIPTIFTADSQMITLDPSSGVNRVSDPIADVLATFSNTNSYLTWHVSGTDSAYFIGTSELGWYRLAPTSSPESGLHWAPNAQIAAGFKCIKSIETTPGVKKLLIGPASSGPILARDLTVSQDNGTPYAANVVIGSLVFAQPNQCAEIESLTTTTKAIGSHPTVAILGDEISGSFEAMTLAVPDPPFLNPPVSLFSDRWYFSQLAQPGFMRHMQLKLSFPAENAANEVLELCIFGSIHTE